MSLLSGMNDMLTNKVAMEAAEDIAMFEEDYALEADELIDAMVDGHMFEDDISEMEEEDEIEDEINDELDAEDNFTDTVGGSANEAAALTGNAFLDSLTRDTNDPITTKNGSIGADSDPTFKGNFSDAFKNTNDPITTKNGSIGEQGSAANFDKNFADASKDTSDPIHTENGSVGQKTSIAKDPAIESARFFGALLGEEVAMEGVINKIQDKKNEIGAKRRASSLKLIGISQDINKEEISELISQKNYDKAKYRLVAFGKKLESAKNRISDDDEDADKKRKTADRLIKSNNASIVRVEEKKKTDQHVKRGMDEKMAKRAARNIIKNNAKKASPAVEAAILDAYKYIEAFEATMDPEATKDGSIGQQTSAATSDKNYSAGKADTDDPIQTKDGSEGQEDSAANFDTNFSDGSDDNNDPISTDNGSVGQKNSTAKDPATESTVEDELEMMNDSLLDDFEDDDDLDD